MTESGQTNIDRPQRRLRLYAGIGSAAGGLVLFVFLLTYGVHPTWWITLFFPFWLASLGVLQFQDGVWVVHAARGTRASNEKREALDDETTRWTLFHRSLRIHLYAILMGTMLTALLYFTFGIW